MWDFFGKIKHEFKIKTFYKEDELRSQRPAEIGSISLKTPYSIIKMCECASPDQRSPKKLEIGKPQKL